jgi:hypothetical protein
VGDSTTIILYSSPATINAPGFHRASDGIAKAKERSVHFGRKLELTPEKISAILSHRAKRRSSGRRSRPRKYLADKAIRFLPVGVVTAHPMEQ